MMKILIKRGKNKNSDYVPEFGEPVYTIEENELMIGDGITSVRNLQTVSILNNIIKSKNGKLYNVYIDEDDNGQLKNISIKPIRIFNPLGEFYIKEN